MVLHVRMVYAPDHWCSAVPDERGRIKYGRLACFSVLGETYSGEAEANGRAQARGAGAIPLCPAGCFPISDLEEDPLSVVRWL